MNIQVQYAEESYLQKTFQTHYLTKGKQIIIFVVQKERLCTSSA